MGRNYYMQGDIRRPARRWKRRRRQTRRIPKFALWLGRAFGRRAETSSPFTAPGYASKARQCFEKSVELNPKNLEALERSVRVLPGGSRLPGRRLGQGGRQSPTRWRDSTPPKATGRAPNSPKSARNFAAPKSNCGAPSRLAPQQIGRFIDLAKFLAKQGRFQEADQSFAKAEKIAPNSPEADIREGRPLHQKQAEIWMLRVRLAEAIPEHER